MLTTGWLVPLLIFVAAIALMIFAISYLKVHPFLSILGTALLLALVMGIPILKIPDVIGKGFSSVFTSIGLVIIFGTLIGLVLEKSGAALRLAESILKVLGKKHPQLAIMLIGWVVSIPVFCDSGFVIVNPIRKWMSRQSGVSSVTMTVALASGLYVAHVFIPPTPGPVAAAGMVGMGDMLLYILIVGTIASIIPLTVAYIFANRVGKRVHSTDETEVEELSKVIDTKDAPGTFISFLPILLPIVLMAVGSVASILKMEGTVGNLLIFLGKPVIALAAGVVATAPLLSYMKRHSKDESNRLNPITEWALKVAGPIVFITAAGAVLGQVIYEAGFIDVIKQNISSFQGLGIIFPFIIAAVLKTAQGSSTVAMTTTAGIMGLYSSSSSLLYTLGMTTPLSAAMVVVAIGAGAMTVSHANDSYFWVVTKMGGLSVEDGYRTQTKATLFMGLSTAVVLYVAQLILL
ncbi:MAG: GntP family permease [Bacteroidales bacterium]|nr:GntP family permease [Bacteroidales bacterium]